MFPNGNWLPLIGSTTTLKETQMLPLSKRLLKQCFRYFGFDIRRSRRSDPGNCPFHDYARISPDSRAPRRQVLLDIGANRGQTIRLMRKVFPAAIIHSFEPNPSVYKALRREYAQVKDTNIWGLAVGETCTTREFGINTKSDMSSFLDQGTGCWGKVNERIPVSVTSLDNFSKEQGITEISLLKIDTQGYEAQVLAGSAGLFASESIKAVLLECIVSQLYRGTAPLWEILQTLDGNGFRLVSFYDQRYQDGLLSWVDALFVHKRHLTPYPESH